MYSGISPDLWRTYLSTLTCRLVTFFSLINIKDFSLKLKLNNKFNFYNFCIHIRKWTQKSYGSRYLHRSRSSPGSRELPDNWINLEDHLGRSRWPQPNVLSMSQQTSYGIDGICSPLLVPVIIIVDFQSDSVDIFHDKNESGTETDSH